MGSSFDTAILDPMPASKVKEAFANLCADRAFDRGHGGYSGTLAEKRRDGVVVRADVVLPSAHAASEWLSDKFEDKWGPAGAVRFAADAPDPKPNKPLIAAQLRLGELRKELDQLPRDMLARAKAVKSKTRGCAKCGSAIAVSHIGNRTACPVCGDGEFLTTAADTQKRDRLKAKVAEVEALVQKLCAQADAARVAAAKADECPWLVGGWCSS